MTRAALGVTKAWAGASAVTRVRARNIIAVVRTQAERLCLCRVHKCMSTRRVCCRKALHPRGTYKLKGTNFSGFDFIGVLVPELSWLGLLDCSRLSPFKLATQP